MIKAAPTTPSSKKPKPLIDDNRLYEAVSPSSLRWDNLSWPVIAWMAAMHLMCLAAPFYFTWSALAVAFGLWFASCCLGVCFGYHRYLAHQGMKVSAPLRFVLYICGCISAQGSPTQWVATHRLHHARSDKPGDPHSPKEGVWWSHLTWLFAKQDPEVIEMLHRKYAPDMLRDPLARFFERWFPVIPVALSGIMYLLGGLPWLLWGMGVRMTIGYHSTWFVNSATHLWGYRNYETTDDSRNNWWVALVTWGEGWHNNHHAHPRVARYGHRWWEVDTTWMVISLCRVLGLVQNVNDRIPSGSRRISKRPAGAAKDTSKPKDRLTELESAPKEFDIFDAGESEEDERELESLSV
ncbi:Fatty acid desaturase [Planctomycetes bacterium Pan216]|uniref:Fatty acid desaturase n=1 Tax=Kolteria novifilia TaxID=2527975 RepID=A0A518B9L9_9BACT|nr:Fatty acid desaturase [Planctomycetes bacterium Pan216]